MTLAQVASIRIVILAQAGKPQCDTLSGDCETNAENQTHEEKEHRFIPHRNALHLQPRASMTQFCDDLMIGAVMRSGPLKKLIARFHPTPGKPLFSAGLRVLGPGLKLSSERPGFRPEACRDLSDSLRTLEV